MVDTKASEIRQRRRTLRHLAKSKSPETRDKLTSMVSSSEIDPEQRFEAIRILGRNFPEATTNLIALLNQEGEPVRVRRAAIHAIGDNRLEGALEAIKSIAERESEEPHIRRDAISTLLELDTASGSRLLIDVLANNRSNKELRRALLRELDYENNDEHRDLLLEIAKQPKEERELRATAISMLGESSIVSSDVLVEFIKSTDEPNEVILSALGALGRRGDENSIDALLELSADETLHDYLRGQAVAALAPYSSRDDIRAMVIDQIINRPGYNQRYRFRVDPDSDWKLVVQEFCQALSASELRRHEIDARLIIQSMSEATSIDGAFPSASGISTSQLQEVLIDEAIDANDRMTGILGELILGLAGGDNDRAGTSINVYEEKHKKPPEKLKKLRIAVGGSTALTPVMKKLSDNLEDRFHKPIKEINEETRAMWRQTIDHAQNGFLIRIWMSVIVFAVGIALLAISSYQFLFGNISGTMLYGSGASFVVGLGMTLLVVYSGPLKEIRQSVNDLGIANVTFIAYVHRVLEISHTFSFYYLQQNITFQEMESSSKLIKEAMSDAIQSFQTEATDSSDKIFTQVIPQTPAMDKAKAPS